MGTIATQPARKVEWLVWAGLVMIVLTLLLLILFAAVKLRTSIGRPLQVYGTVAEFTLTNQNGQTISLTNLRGHPWVADIIFTRCAGPCPKMTRFMSELQQTISPTSRIRFA